MAVFVDSSVFFLPSRVQPFIEQKGGGMIDLEPRLAHMSAVEPSLAPVSAERTMTTRAAASV